jgi:hypothetical protein
MNTIVYPPSQMEFEWDEAKNMVKNDDRLGRIEKCYRRDGMYTTRRKHSCHLRSNQSLSNLASLLISFRKYFRSTGVQRFTQGLYMGKTE